MDRVRAELEAEGRKPSPQSRDMNPIYTGKDVSYIDTKQAQRAAEVAAVDAEKLGTFADLLGLGTFAEAALDKAWRQLAYGAHHDAITGSESDQVYIDLVTGWREAHDLSADARDAALSAFAARIDTSSIGAGTAVVVTNTLSFPRTDLVSVADAPSGARVVDAGGNELPSVVEGETLTFLAHDVPSLGWRTYRLVASSNSTAAWGAGDTSDTVENEFFTVTVDPSRGGGVSSIVDKRTGRQVLRGLGNELRVYEEYPDHPRFGEGPWHLTPSGPGAVEGEPGRPTGLTVTPATNDLRLAPGERTSLDLTFANDTHSEIRAELQLASPYGTWAWLPEPLRAVVVPAKSSLVVEVPVQAPADAGPAHAWVLPKVMWFGRAQYAATVRLEVTG